MRSGIDLDSLLEKVGNHFCVDVKELKSGSRSRDIAEARSVLCCLGVRNLGLTCVMMAKALGVSPSAVSKSSPLSMRSWKVWNGKGGIGVSSASNFVLMPASIP